MSTKNVYTAAVFIVSALLVTVTSVEATDSTATPLAKWSIAAPNASSISIAHDFNGQRIESAPGTPVDLTFCLGPDLSEGPYKPLEYSSQKWYESTFWTGPDWTRVGDRWHHPGNLTPSIRRFAVPRDGQIAITGRVFKLHLNGDGIRAAIHHNDREVWSAEIEGRTPRASIRNYLSLYERAIHFVSLSTNGARSPATQLAGIQPSSTRTGRPSRLPSRSASSRELGNGSTKWNRRQPRRRPNRNSLPSIRTSSSIVSWSKS